LLYIAINDFIKHISKNYLTESQERFDNNELAKYIRYKPGELMPDTIKQQFHIVSSPGKGQWSLVPWVGVFDKELSVSALRGIT